MKNLLFSGLLALSMMTLTTGCTNGTEAVASAKCGSSAAPCGSGKCGSTGKCGGSERCGGAGKCGSPAGGK